MTEMVDHGDGVVGQVEDQPVGIEPAAVDVDAEVAMIRELVYQAHPDVVRELLVGQTLTDILASIEPARAAYQRIAEQVVGGPGAGTGGEHSFRRWGGDEAGSSSGPGDIDDDAAVAARVAGAGRHVLLATGWSVAIAWRSGTWLARSPPPPVNQGTGRWRWATGWPGRRAMATTVGGVRSGGTGPAGRDFSTSLEMTENSK